jgi:hypothetical protein
MPLSLQLALTCIATIVIELGVLLLLGERRKKVLVSSIIINILTNIPLNLFLIYVIGGMTAIFIGELLVFIIETLWYYYFVRDIKQAAIYSALCNAISFLLGMLVQLIYAYFYFRL